MEVIDLSLKSLKEAPWNSNRMDPQMMARLRQSIEHYGLVEPLVVRPMTKKTYEVIGGNCRLKILTEMGFEKVHCTIVDIDDAHARLLSQALNRIEGEDDLGLRAELMKKVLESVSREEVCAILPETADSLNALSSLGQETIAQYLKNWQQAQAARLKHLQFQLTPAQLEVVEKVLEQVLAGVTANEGNPNRRGFALYQLCQNYLEDHGGV